MRNDYDLMVIGAGMAGISAATKCASNGWRVAIADELPYGCTCALRGCDPKKILRRGAEVVEDARLMRGKGVVEGSLSMNWGELMSHKHGFTDPIPQSMAENLRAHGVETLQGTASFTDRAHVDVAGTSYGASRVLITTGAAPVVLEFPG